MQCFVSFAAWYCNLFKKFSKLAARYFATIDSLFIFWEAGTTYFSYINIKLLLPFRLIAYSYIMLVVVLLVLMMAEWCWWWCFGECGVVGNGKLDIFVPIQIFWHQPNFDTGSACGACDKYQVWTVPIPIPHG